VIDDSASQHAANTHNRRLELDALWVYFDGESIASLPYDYLASKRLTENGGKLVLKFMDCTVTVEGKRLRVLMKELDSRHRAFIRANDEAFDAAGNAEPFITKITLTEH
jgi:hypothetical protein